jgi:hypothetical protein
MSNAIWAIGQLAKRTGVSVRALRHFDEIGLLSPADRTASGYRLHVAEDVSSEEFLDLIEVMSMVENTDKYYTPEQLAWLQERAEMVGDELDLIRRFPLR